MVNKLILNELRKIQDKESFLSEKSLKKVADKFKVSVGELYEAASFYSFFDLEKRGKFHIKVCESPVCHMKGSDNILDIIEKLTGLKPGESNAKFSVDIASCIGCCDKAPAMMINDKVFTELNEEKIKKILKNEDFK